ncbi:MAG: hydrolase [Methylophaga sp.]|nr:hydrolase [Methylophaga sp.]MAY34444.1 hydrolase [Rhodovulum sp.]|tara:strand:+ start:1120 stop:1713 length:594 start_codon:yes stop_codon:yes gene_type:complete
MITETQYKEAAQTHNIEIAAIKAVNEVEARGEAFLPDGSLKILFEGHVFWKRLKANDIDPEEVLDQESKDILYKHWTRKYYKGGIAEYDRLIEAFFSHENPMVQVAAYESCSWGSFQIMGYHWKSLGYVGVFAFLSDLRRGEYYNLKAFLKFCEANNLTRHLRSKNWAAFARGYNGPGYKQNKYDIKLEKAYNKFAK